MYIMYIVTQSVTRRVCPQILINCVGQYLVKLNMRQGFVRSGSLAKLAS